MLNDNNKKSLKKMLKSNALYFALGLCFLAVGVIGFGISSSTPTGVSDSTTNKYEYATQSENTTQRAKENYEIKINIDEFTTLPYEEPSTAAVFDNSASEISPENEKMPVVFSVPLSSGVGMDYSMGIPVFSQTMNDYRTHNGVDFFGVKGESVKTVAEGTVVSVEKDALWGNKVYVDHGNGITSCISGLADEALISVGAKVYSDTVIGVVGEIPVEKQDKAHVHLEIRENGKLTDPMEILGLDTEE